MHKLITVILFAAAAIVAVQDRSFAETLKKGTYASCVATAEKHGSTAARATEWCTRHGTH